VQRSVLIVTPFFAPQNHAAVFRAYKLAKYLPPSGWKPIVLTVDTQYQYNEDPAMLADLPNEVEIVKARYIEPTIRGTRMALGGKDRTFKALKHRDTSKEGNSAATDQLRAVKKAYQYLLENWVHNPDAYWTWARSATPAGMKLVREKGISVVVTSASPYSCLEVGLQLQKCGAKWVADFRDPLAYSQRLANYSPRIYARQRAIVRAALTHADAVTVLASSYKSIFRDLFGNGYPDPVFIPTGIDEAVVARARNEQHGAPYLIFAGEFLPEYDTSFLEAFSLALLNAEVRRTGIKLVVVGSISLSESRLMPQIQKFGIQQFVAFRDQMPQGELYGLIQNARAGALIPGTTALWWTNFAKMTDFIGLRKPVIAVVPDPSEARTALTRSRLGVFLDGSPEQRAQTLTDFLLGRYPMPDPNQEECERYTAWRQVQSFVEVFESILKPKTLSAAAR
jgi:glycosyltransferase involved in cell wall biosynthesis